MRVFGLIGFPVTHSFSKTFFANKFKEDRIKDAVYELFPLQNLSEFGQLIRKNINLKGLNVTIPYKQTIIPFLNILSDEATEIGAVNVIRINTIKRQIFLEGYNTDHYGFAESIKPHLRIHHQNALILGTGGSAQAVAYALKKLKINVTFVSRTPENGALDYQALDSSVIESHQIIINCSPVGMHKLSGQKPELPYNQLTSKHLLYDLVYNPAETEFLKAGKKYGAKTMNGLQMLHIQAEKSWEIWNA